MAQGVPRDRINGGRFGDAALGLFSAGSKGLGRLRGEGRLKDVEARVERLIAAELLPGDRAMMARGRERWRVMIQRARKPLISEGWLEPRPGGLWKITASGRVAAKSEAAAAAAQNPRSM